MTKAVWTGTVAAVICTAGLALSAQTYPSSQSSMSSDKDKGQAITVTGCIERASQSAVGTSGATSTTGSSTSSSSTSARSESSKFLLTNVTAGTSGTAETAPATPSPTATSYRLDAKDSELSPHVGHTVEIKGRVMSSDTAAATPSREPGPPNTSASSTATSSSEASAPKLKVESVRMISESCSK